MSKNIFKEVVPIFVIRIFAIIMVLELIWGIGYFSAGIFMGDLSIVDDAVREYSFFEKIVRYFLLVFIIIWYPIICYGILKLVGLLNFIKINREN